MRQGSGYSLRVSSGSLYGVSPVQIPYKCWVLSNLVSIFHQTYLNSSFVSSFSLISCLSQTIYLMLTDFEVYIKSKKPVKLKNKTDQQIIPTLDWECIHACLL